MRNFKQKLTLLFWPGMWLMFLLIAVYSAIRWLLDFKLHLVRLDQVWLDYWIPMLFIVVCVWIFVDHRIVSVVNFGDTKKTGYESYPGYVLISSCMILLALSSSQDLLSLVSGKEVVASHIFDVDQLHINDRLVLEDFSPVEGSAANYTRRYSTRGSGSKYYYRDYFVVCLGSSSRQQFWYGVRYNGGRLTYADPQAYRDSIENELYQQHRKRFEQQLKEGHFFLKPVFEVVEQNQFMEAINTSALKKRSEIVILSPTQKAYKEAVYRQLAKTLSSIGLVLLVYLFCMLQINLKPDIGKD